MWIKLIFLAKSEVLESFMTANERIIGEENLEARVMLTQVKTSYSFNDSCLQIRCFSWRKWAHTINNKSASKTTF